MVAGPVVVGPEVPGPVPVAAPAMPSAPPAPVEAPAALVAETVLEPELLAPAELAPPALAGVAGWEASPTMARMPAKVPPAVVSAWRAFELCWPGLDLTVATLVTGPPFRLG